MTSSIRRFTLLTNLNPEVKMKIRIVARGRWTVYAICTERGDCPVLTFLLDRVSRDGLAEQKARMVQRLRSLALSGPPRKTSISHQIDPGVWQLELGRIRILWFYGTLRSVVVAHGFVKSTRQTPDRDKRVAWDALTRYREALRHDSLRILEDS
jgi:phage-related protein